MSFLFEAGNLPYRYVYLGRSTRNPGDNPKNIRTRVGKIDPVLNERIFSKEFLSGTEVDGIHIPEDLQLKALHDMVCLADQVQSRCDLRENVSQATISALDSALILAKSETRSIGENPDLNVNLDQLIYSIRHLLNSTRKNYGSFYLFESIADSTGLKNVLMASFPGDWKEIYMLACYLLSTGEPMMYCQKWIEETDGLPVSLSSSSISKLMASISQRDIDKFYENWAECRKEFEFIAGDISSISTYSEFMNEVDWGYNREHDKLKQLNIFLLYGEKSHLPIYMKSYNGAVKDVSTLKTSLTTTFSIGLKNI
jgi:hypothetical protein